MRSSIAIRLSSCPSPQTLSSDGPGASELYAAIDLGSNAEAVLLTSCGSPGATSLTVWDPSWDSEDVNVLEALELGPLAREECWVSGVAEEHMSAVEAQVCCGTAAVVYQEAEEGEFIVKLTREGAEPGPLMLMLDCDGSVDCTDEDSRDANGARGTLSLAADAACPPACVHGFDACPTGFRALEPLKITSVMDSPRRYLAELSPMTQRTASMIFDLPQPLGPTTAVMLEGKGTVVGSTKDLKPDSLMDFSRISGALFLIENGQNLLALVLAKGPDHSLELLNIVTDRRLGKLP